MVHLPSSSQLCDLEQSAGVAGHFFFFDRNQHRCRISTDAELAGAVAHFSNDAKLLHIFFRANVTSEFETQHSCQLTDNSIAGRADHLHHHQRESSRPFLSDDLMEELRHRGYRDEKLNRHILNEAGHDLVKALVVLKARRPMRLSTHDALAYLNEHGFDDLRQNVQVLRECDDDIYHAIEILSNRRDSTSSKTGAAFRPCVSDLKARISRLRPAAVQDNVDYERDTLTQLFEAGFQNMQANVAALQLAQNDLPLAIEILLNK